MKANLLFEQLINKQHLTAQQMHAVIKACMSGEFNDVHIAAFLALMRMKGETIAELTAAAQVMQDFGRKVTIGTDLIDIVGTGGDGKNTFNVSTASSFVVAAAGIAVAKHGNRSVSSRSGSADVLEQAGFRLNLSEDNLERCIAQCKLAFLFAPHYHPAMQHARNARQQLGIRTLFNLLGPLINPAQVKKQVVGVYSAQWLQPIAKVLANLGSERALVLSSQDGMDEVSIVAPTDVVEYHHSTFYSWTINPQDYLMQHVNVDEIVVDSPAQSLAIIQEVLAGVHGAARDIVLLNSAAAIYCAKENLTFIDALEQAKTAIDSGLAVEHFATLRALTQQLTQSKEAKHD